ncbi:XdhC family protein [Streptomyces broussonetiae]|uniref:XdhC family protein n=1 Tax=Streptomyces broussonetiae TaxID=2686304 RepID=UPI001E2B7D5C|nr:XdhC family protein [Streptomyces broussonetiae]
MTDRRTVVCVMTHDPEFDVPVLVEALGRPLAHVAALGSRRTRARRLRNLAEAGVSPDALAGLHPPLGPDLGATTPQETAVSFAAELMAGARRPQRPFALRTGRTPAHGAARGSPDRGRAPVRCRDGSRAPTVKSASPGSLT